MCSLSKRAWFHTLSSGQSVTWTEIALRVLLIPWVSLSCLFLILFVTLIINSTFHTTMSYSCTNAYSFFVCLHNFHSSLFTHLRKHAYFHHTCKILSWTTVFSAMMHSNCNNKHEALRCRRCIVFFLVGLQGAWFSFQFCCVSERDRRCTFFIFLEVTQERFCKVLMMSSHGFLAMDGTHHRQFQTPKFSAWKEKRKNFWQWNLW